MSKPRKLAANRPRSVTIQGEHGGSFRTIGASYGPPDGVPELRRKARLRGSRTTRALLQAEGGSLTAQQFAAKLNVAPTTVYRWQRQWKVVGKDTPGLPYVISVIVTYNNDSGTPKTTRLDLERRKSW